MDTQLLQRKQDQSVAMERLENRLHEIEQAIEVMRQSKNKAAADMIKTYSMKARHIRDRIRQLRGVR